MNVVLYVIAGWQVVGALASVHMIGKPRKPLAHGGAVVVLIASLLVVWALLVAAHRLG